MGAMSCKERPSTATANDEFIEAAVAETSELANGEMKEVTIMENLKVLLVKDSKGQVSAIGTKCSHYGAPLIKGALGEDRVRCPWHGACFNIKTGDIEDFPGLDGIPSYDVREVEGRLVVRARKRDLEANKRTCTMVAKESSNKKTAVVIGGGGAGASCVESLRQKGFTGNIILVSQEKHLPYDRPKLSKAMDAEAIKLALRTEDFYQKHGIDLKLGAAVESINTAEKNLVLVGGEKISYDAVLIATGSVPRGVSDMPGGTLKNIYTLRTADDANLIASNAKGKNVVILGNSFIGMESAAYFAEKAASVVVVGRSSVPFEPVLGKDVGARVLQIFTEAKVQHIGGRKFVSFSASAEDPESVGNVHLDDGQVLKADVVVLGIGATAATVPFEGGQINIDPRGNIPVDENMQSNVPGVFAAGDVAAARLTLNGAALPDLVSIGHWQLAHYHGKVAGRNMAAYLAEKPEQMQKAAPIPFFWTVLFGKSIRYAGYGAGFDDIHLTGDLANLQFVAYYLKNGEVVAVATLNSDPVAAKFAEHLAGNKRPVTKADLTSDHTAWQK